MNLSLLVSLFGLLLGTAAPSQARTKCKVYPTPAASDAWVVATRQLPLKQRVAAVRQRLVCDAQVRGHVFEVGVCVSCLSAEGRRAYLAALAQRQAAEEADPRPRGITLYYVVDGRPLAEAELPSIQQVLTKKRVKEISLYEGKEAVVLGGSRAADGMVVITTK